MPTARANLAVILEDAARAGGWSGHTAFIVGDTAFAYADVYAGMRRCAAALAARGVRPGYRVLIALPDSIEVVWSLLGAWYLGAVAVMANPRLPHGELAEAARRSAPALVVCDGGIGGVFEGVPTVGPARLMREGDRAMPVAAHPVAGGDPAYALFTSGTTGEPKLCFHGHQDALVHQEAFGGPVLGLRPGDVTLSVSKTYFAYGLGNSVFYPLLSGGTAVLVPEAPSADLVCDRIARHAIRVLFAVPSFYARMLSDQTAGALAALGMTVCAGEVLPATVEEGLDRLDGPVTLNGIGTTEVGQTFASNAPRSRRRGTVGRVLPPYRVRIATADGTDAPPGSEGRLLVSGSTLAFPCPDADSYRPAATDWWYETGDVATADEDGYLTILGRHDDVEIVGGINVRPTEVEHLITGHARVADAAVCAVTDKRGVSRLVAFVVLADRVAEHGGLEADILAATRRELAAYKVPRQVVLVPGLPRTPNGKLRRSHLRRTAADYELHGVWRGADHGPLSGIQENHRRCAPPPCTRSQPARGPGSRECCSAMRPASPAACGTR